MIVKIKNNDETWNYFEGDNIQQFAYGDNQGKTTPEHKSDMVYCKNVSAATNDGIVLCIQKENKIIARINTNQPTYIMNDLGKTIDKLI